MGPAIHRARHYGTGVMKQKCVHDEQQHTQYHIPHPIVSKNNRIRVESQRNKPWIANHRCNHLYVILGH